MFEESEIDDFESNLFASLRSSKPKQKLEGDSKESTKKLFDINDDDLLDLLSDDDPPPHPPPSATKTPNTKVMESGSSPSPEHQSGSADDDSSVTTYVPSSNPIKAASPYRPILKTASSNSLGEVHGGRKTSAVRFMDEVIADQSGHGITELHDENGLLKETSTPSTSVSNKPVSNKHVPVVSSTLTSSSPVSSTPVPNIPKSNIPASLVTVSNTPVFNTSISSISSTPVSNMPLSNTLVSSVSNTPVSITPLSNTLVSSTPVSSTPVSNTPVSNMPLSNTLVSSKPVSSVSSTLLSTTTPVSSIFNSKPELSNSLDTKQDEEQPPFLSTDDDDDNLLLQFGAYVPSNSTPRRATMGRRRQSVPNSTQTPSTEEKHLRKSISSIKDPVTTTMAELRPTSLNNTMPITTIAGHEAGHQERLYSSLTQPDKSLTTVTQPHVSSTPTITHSTAPPPALPSELVHMSSFNTHPISTTDSSIQVAQLEKQLMEYKATIDKKVEQQQEDLVHITSTQAKLDASEMEKKMLMKSLEDTKNDLAKEKQLLKEYIQSMDSQVKDLRHEIEDSYKTNENRLREELIEVKRKHEEEIMNLKQDHDRSSMQWKNLLASQQTEQKATNDKLLDTQRHLLESVQSLDSSISSGFHRLHTDLSDKIQSSVKQMGDLYSSVIASQNIDQSATTEALFEKLAARQKIHLNQLSQRMDDFIEKDKCTLSKLETSLLTKRKSIEEEHARIMLQIRQERDALQKQKDHFFSEQQAWLSDNYSEKHHMMKVQAIANETFTRNQKFEAELNCMKVSLEKERNVLSLEQSKLIQERQQLEQDKLKLNQTHQAVLALEQSLKIQATQVNETSHLTQQAYLEGQQTLIAAKEMQKVLNKKLSGLQILETGDISTQDQIKQNAHTLSTDEDHFTTWCTGQTEAMSNSVLLQLQHNQSVRDNLNELKKDDEKLEKETEFLHLIRIGRKTT